MIYRHPLAYLLGLEGVALFRAFAGEYDREFIGARIAEIRTLLDSAERLGDRTEVPEITSVEGYDNRSVDYDERDNSLINLEQPIVHEILDRLPIGVALNAGCGTGRHAAYLASLGHTVIGVDSSPGMSAKARAKVPAGEFHEADLHRLPIPDNQVDLVVCGLALTHVPELAPVISESVRVLRPGGHLVTSESPGLAFGGIGNPLVKIGPDGNPGVRQQPAASDQ
ncbi:MAG TPA: class I SAM-dependent methyltransferase [Mycobacteriales bacterium]|jgi:SAM-dependent methyltransferase|nr:class I SAM-dependent methyltransferase [Mycobacteriales bacterium]